MYHIYQHLYHHKLFINILLTVLSATFVSCEKITDIDPPRNEISKETVFASDQIATSAVRGIYSAMVSDISFVAGANSIYMGWSADELVIYAATSDEFKEVYNNSLTSNNNVVNRLWTQGYQYIYYANSVMEGLAASDNVSLPIKTMLEGEAKFIRALCFFNLVNIWGGVPLVLTTDYRINSNLSRASYQEVYSQIVKDLEDAKNLLGEQYATSEKTRPNRWAAIALLARVHLYNGNWEKAEELSSLLINNSSVFFLEQDVNKVFQKGSTETILELRPVQSPYNSNDGAEFVLTATPDKVSLDEDLVAMFEAGDNRLSSWIGIYTDPNTSISYYYPFKYKVKEASDLTEYNIVFRLSEQYLIRAEARIHLGKVSDGIADINVVRARARGNNPGDLPDLPVDLDAEEASDKLEHERIVELFTEGHRWFDLKRTNRINDVLSAKKQNWNAYDSLYPIPQSQLLNDPNMADEQNPGYN